MKNQRGFVGLPVLIWIVLGLIVVGGGAYFVVHQQTTPQTSSDNFDNVQTLPTTSQASQQTQPTQQVSPKPTTNTTQTNPPATVQWQTYTNIKQGYSIKYPSGWIVEPEKQIVDGVNKIYSNVKIHDSTNTHAVQVQVDGKEWLLKNEAPQTAQVSASGSAQTAYLFPNGYECYGAKPGDDCSFFVIPILNNGVWYELYANGDAKTVTQLYKDIFLTFTLTNRESVIDNSQGKSINVSNAISYYGNGTFLGNDPISFSWTSNYITISPVLYLYNSGNLKVYSKNLPAGSNSSSAKFGESTAANQNLSTGSYKIEVCDLGVQDSSGKILCGQSSYFNITATNAPFQP